MVRYAAGTVVWAQFGEYPHWPGRVAPDRITGQLVEHKGTGGIGILFFGRPLTYALVPLDQVVGFEENLELYRRGDGSSDFEMALEMATSDDRIEDPPLIIKHRGPYEHTKRGRTSGAADEATEDQTADEDIEDTPANEPVPTAASISTGSEIISDSVVDDEGFVEEEGGAGDGTAEAPGCEWGRECSPGPAISGESANSIAEVGGGDPPVKAGEIGAGGHREGEAEAENSRPGDDTAKNRNRG